MFNFKTEELINWCNFNQGFLMVILTAIYVVATILIFCSNNKSTKLLTQQIKLQKDQWLSDLYMKREAEILLEFREALYNAQKSIDWFLNSMLTPLKIQKTLNQDVNPKSEQLIIKREEYLFHLKNINRINDLYNKNQIIFRKYHFEDVIPLIHCILNVSFLRFDGDFKYVLLKEDDKSKEYILENFGEIVISFINTVAFGIDIKPDLSKQEDIEKMTYINKHAEETLEKYKMLISSKINSLIMTLDEMTIYYEGKIPNNMKIRCCHFYPYIDRENK